MNTYQVSVSAEAFAAAMLARAGCDVSVQYGANQPEYDLLAAKGTKLIRVSVKGSQDGSWIAAGSYKTKDVTYAQALNQWKHAHNPKTIFVFVQFYGVEFTAPPRMYMANVGEIAKFLAGTRGGHINLILHEEHQYVRGVGAGHKDVIPQSWVMTKHRIDELIMKYG